MKIVRRLAPVVVLACALFIAWLLVMPHSVAGLRAFGASTGALGPLVFLAIWTIATPSLVSGTLLAAASGMLFGPLVGTAISIVGATLGAAVSFGIARRLGGDALGGLGRRAGAVKQRLERNGFRSVLCLRAAPGMPATILNYAAGLARIRLRDFLAASAIGGAPRAFAYAALGAGASHPSAWAAALPVTVLVVMTVVGLALARGVLRAPPAATAASG